LEVALDAENKEAAEEAKNKPDPNAKIEPYEIRDSIIDDWTGHRWAKNWRCYGREPCTKENWIIKDEKAEEKAGTPEEKL